MQVAHRFTLSEDDRKGSLYAMEARPFNAMACWIFPVLAVVLLFGDAARSPAAEPGKADRPAAAATRDAVANPPWGDVQLVVYKSRRTLALYRGGDFRKEFRIVLGLQPQGRKRHANDARTPEGLYHVTAKHRHDRWQWFLSLDYPNDTDRREYERAVKHGRIPDEHGVPFAIGGSVGIHGNDRAEVQDKGIDWTKGCIAMTPADIAELARETPVGTPVWIVE